MRAHFWNLSMDLARIVLLIFLIIFMLASPDGQRTSPSQQRQLAAITKAEWNALDLLRRTQYGDFDVTNGKWMNVTGLRPDDGYAWNLLPAVQARAREQAKDVLHATWISTGLAAYQKIEIGTFGDRYLSVDSLDGLTKPARPNANQTIPFYKNITGMVRGRWIRSKVGKGFQPPVLNLSAISPVPYASAKYNWNVTGNRGHLTLKLDEKSGKSIQLGDSHAREIRVEMTLQDENSHGDGSELVLYGTHYLDSGAAILSTTGDKFAGIFFQPHFARSNGSFRLAQTLLNQTLATAVTNQEQSHLNPSYPWASSPDNPSELMFPTPHCEYIVYLQQHFVWPYEARYPSTKLSNPQHNGFHGKDSSHLLKLESELRQPTGATFNFIPELKFSAVIFSPDCGFVLESQGSSSLLGQDSDHLKGPKAELYHRNVRQITELLSILIGAQILLLIRQMKLSSTPSTRSRVSYYTMAMMALGDGFAFLSFMALSLFTDVTFLTVVSAAFLAFLCVSFFGMKFLMDIYVVQSPERGDRETRRIQESQTPPNTSQTERNVASHNVQHSTIVSGSAVIPSRSALLTLPVTVSISRNSGASPIVILPPDQDIEADADENNPQDGPQTNNQTPLRSARREMGAFYSKFYFLLLGIVFLSLNATRWPNHIRTIYANVLVGIYLSFWIPQIVRNVKRNCRKALRWEFVIGQSILRLSPFIYFYTIEGNVLFVKTDVHTLYFFLGWIWAQVLGLLSQEVFGPRFLVPDGWAPPAYDYHPVLRENDEETGTTLPIGFTRNVFESEAKNCGRRVFDCAICMHNINVPMVSTSSTGQGAVENPSSGPSIFSRRTYMVTPCRHIFHSACLEGWMRYKLQCPICRDTLPPI